MGLLRGRQVYRREAVAGVFGASSIHAAPAAAMIAFRAPRGFLGGL